MHKRPRTFVYVIHRSPGRVRLRMRWLREQPDVARRLVEEVTEVDGVVEVQLRPLTGSFLCRFDPAIVDEERLGALVLRITGAPRLTIPGQETPEEISALLEESVRRGSELSRALAQSAKSLDFAILRASEGEVSLGTLLSLVFLAAAVTKGSRTERLQLPEWYQLAWWSYRMFSTSEAVVLDNMPNELLEVMRPHPAEPE